MTHLPQVASQGHQQMRVEKRADGGSTRTTLAELGASERIEELARMLGGVDVTDSARAHARALLAGTGPLEPPRPAKRAARRR
ncbi:DNA repair protein RecN [mine drainage metagenome]|uniref:DNA repair protein RecN n=1 Tax=mine drainage metagenome TaxID=410659 RepID=T1A8W5_9ZZZZ